MTTLGSFLQPPLLPGHCVHPYVPPVPQFPQGAALTYGLDPGWEKAKMSPPQAGW